MSTPINWWLQAGFFALQALQLAILPLWLLPADARWGWLLLLPVLATNPWWAFLHDALHGSLHRHRAGKHRLGRANAVLFGAGFDLLRPVHRRHPALPHHCCRPAGYARRPQRVQVPALLDTDSMACRHPRPAASAGGRGTEAGGPMALPQ